MKYFFALSIVAMALFANTLPAQAQIVGDDCAIAACIEIELKEMRKTGELAELRKQERLSSDHYALTLPKPADDKSKQQVDRLQRIAVSLKHNKKMVNFFVAENLIWFEHFPIFTFPVSNGISVVFKSRTLDEMDDEDVRAILAHELSHDEDDGIRRVLLSQRNWPEEEKLELLTFWEMLADQKAVLLLKRSGQNPGAMATSLRNISAKFKDIAEKPEAFAATMERRAKAVEQPPIKSKRKSNKTNNRQRSKTTLPA